MPRPVLRSFSMQAARSDCSPLAVVPQAAVLAMRGPRVGAVLLLPPGFMAFLVPFGDEIIPPLLTITAHIAIALTHLCEVPATIDGIYTDTPAWRFVEREPEDVGLSFE